MLEGGRDPALRSFGGVVMRERSESGAGSASVSDDSASAELEDGSNRLDSGLDLLLDAIGRIGPWLAIEAALRLTPHSSFLRCLSLFHRGK